MKKKLSISIVLILLSITAAIGFIQYNTNRYKINQPMMDLEYKKSIIKDSHNLTYKLENLRPLVGQEELSDFIKKNDNNPNIYTPSDKNVKNKIFRANLHIHSTNSDGAMNVKEILDFAQSYASSLPQNEYFYVAITDHNTVLGSQDIISVLEKYPDRYSKLKIITGIEIYTSFKSQYSKRRVPIHVLTWCINPYDQFLNKEFYKKDLNDKWNHQFDRNFVEVMTYMSKKGIVGIAHPVRYITFLNKDIYPYIKEVFTAYKNASTNLLFTEGYYQSYDYFSEKDDLKGDYKHFLKYVNDTAKELGVYRTGSTDTHGFSLFTR